MKSLYLAVFFFFCLFPVFSQNDKAAQADVLALEKNYVAEIELRNEIMVALQDTLSEEYKEQAYKRKLAKSFLVQDLNEAALLIEEAMALFGTMKKRPAREKIKMLSEYSVVLMWVGKTDKAWEMANRAYDLVLKKNTKADPYQREIAGLLKRFAHIKWAMGEHDAAIDYFKQSFKKTVELRGYYSMQAGDICRFLSIVYTFTPNFNAGLEYGLKAQEIYEKIQPEDKFILFRQYANNFTNFKEYGDLEKVETLIEKITTYYETNKNDEAFMHGHHQNFPNLNAVKTTYYYKKLEYAAAIQDTIQAEHYYALFQKIVPKKAVSYSPMERNSIVKYNLETGSLFQHTGNYEKAKKYYLNAQEFSRSIHYPFGELQAYWILTTLGVDFQQWDDVVLYSEKALNHPDIENFNRAGTIRHNLAYAHFGKEQYEKAAEFLTEELTNYLNAPESLNDFVIQQNLIEIGNVLLEIHQNQPQTSYLEKAYQAYHQASVIFSRIYQSGKFNERLATFQNSINGGMLRCSFLLKKHQATALAQVEMNNSDYLWSSFLRNQHNFSVDPLHFEHKIDSLQKKNEVLKAQIALSETPEVQKGLLKEKIQHTEAAITNIRLKMTESKEHYYRFSQTSFQLENFQTDLVDGEMVIKYIVTDSLVFAYGITKNRLLLEQLPISKDHLYTKANSYLSTLKNREENYREKAKELYTVLMAPMQSSSYNKITIIPDAFLSYLPFETLIDPEGNFLVKNHSMGYASSLKLWSIQKNIQEKAESKLGVFSPEYNLNILASVGDDADVATLVRAGNYELKGAREEAQKISSLFSGNLFISDSATKTNFIRNVANYDILHLAMHAMVDEKQPDNSSLIFSNNEKLRLSELYHLKVPARLVVLSACNTGAGSIKNGEGVQSLSRAFTYAGVKSTVRSLWPVPDRETAEIMTGFYRQLKKGKGKAGALRQAKLDYLTTTSEETMKHPYYWAGFVVSGDTSPIISPISQWWYALGGLVVLGMIVSFARKRTKTANSAA